MNVFWMYVNSRKGERVCNTLCREQEQDNRRNARFVLVMTNLFLDRRGKGLQI